MRSKSLSPHTLYVALVSNKPYYVATSSAPYIETKANGTSKAGRSRRIHLSPISMPSYPIRSPTVLVASTQVRYLLPMA